MKLATLISLTFVACVASGCPDDEPDDQDSGTNTPVDTGTAVNDAGTSDASSNNDAAPGSDATIDVDGSVGTDGGPRQCTTIPEVRGVFYGRMGPNRTFEPTAPSPQVVPIIQESGDFVAAATGFYTPDGIQWHAQISSLTMFDSFDEYEYALDDVDGSLYAAVSLQVAGSSALRFYNADGTLFKEFTQGGPSGSDIIGASRQENFFVMKYSATGALLWVHRFGPNRGGDRAGYLASMGLVGDRVRVVASVENSTDLAFGPGTAREYVYQAGGATAWWAEFSRETGEYIPSSARFVVAESAGSGTSAYANGTYAHAAKGELAFAGLLYNDSGTNESFTIGLSETPTVTGAIDLIIPRSTAVFAKIAADGTPQYVGTASRDMFNAGVEPRAVAIATNGTLVAGGQSQSTSSTVTFTGATNQQSVFLERDNSFVVAFSATGDVLWVNRISSPSRNAVSEILTYDDGVYLMGTFAEGDTFSAGANVLTVGTTGYGLVRFSLATGEAEWIRTFVDSASAYTVSVSGSQLLVPTGIFQTVTIVGGPQDITFTEDMSLLGAMLFDPNGDFSDCHALARGVQSFQSL